MKSFLTTLLLLAITLSLSVHADGTVNVRMPNGIIITNAPVDVKREEILEFYNSKDAEHQIRRVKREIEEICGHLAGTAQNDFAAKKIYSACQEKPVEIIYR